MNQKMFIALILSIVLIASTTYALNKIIYNVPNSGIIITSPNIKLYHDESLTQEYINNTTYDWAELSIGENTKDWWIKNVGNCPVILGLTVISIPSGWSLTWDYDNSPLNPGAVVHVVITLTIPENEMAGTYTWTYQISATENV